MFIARTTLRIEDILFSMISTSRSIILAGDFNFVEDTTLDKNIENDALGTGGRKEIISLKNDFNLVDPFRIRYPKRKIYTWSGRGIYSRLDRFYISKSLLDNTGNMDLIHFPNSDHCLFTLDLNNLHDKISIGPSYWKANTSIFTDSEFIRDMEELWNDFSIL